MEVKDVGNLFRNIVLGLLLTLLLDHTSLYGLRTFYRTKIDPLVAECKAKVQNRSVFCPPLRMSISQQHKRNKVLTQLWDTLYHTTKIMFLYILDEVEVGQRAAVQSDPDYVAYSLSLLFLCRLVSRVCSANPQ